MRGTRLGLKRYEPKRKILDYLNGSFAHLAKAIDAIGDERDGESSPNIAFEKGARRLGSR